MKIIDLHCDVLYKLAKSEEPLSFRSSEVLDVTLEKLQKANVKAQVFAIFVDDELSEAARYLQAMRQLEKFQYEVIAPHEEMIHITSWTQLASLQEGQIGAVLSLEGCDAIGSDLHKLQTFIDAGILLCGLTWNHENAVAFGAAENPQNGLKAFGREVIELLNKHEIIVDVSHLNKQGFWDVLPLAKYVIASHSNARAIQDHARNLEDEQIAALMNAGGHLHCVFYPPFITDNKPAEIGDLLEHIQHIAKVGTLQQIGLGSDFDGIDMKVRGLESAEQTVNLLNELAKIYTDEEVRGIAAQNFEHFVSTIKA